MSSPVARPAVPAFDRRFFEGTEQFTCIGNGEFGGKAHTLLTVKDLLAAGVEGRARRHFDVHVPTLTVIATDMFEGFMDSNRLWDLVHSGASDHRIGRFRQQRQLVHFPVQGQTQNRLRPEMQVPRQVGHGVGLLGE